MFSLQQIGDLIYHEILSSSSQTNQQDLIVNLRDHVNMEGNPNLAASKARKRQRDRSTDKLNPEDLKSEHMHRKMVHREIEKKRREDLSKLYALLSNLLPPSFEKGKRSIADCTHEAVSYINQMQEKIEILNVKRDQIKKYGDMSAKDSLLNVIPNVVSISACNGRSYEIQINSSSNEDVFPLSEILKALFEDGLDVITCTSKKINKRVLYSIQCEANDTTMSDLSFLQQKLTAIASQ